MVYRPWQFAQNVEVDANKPAGQRAKVVDAGAYQGWDLLVPTNYAHFSLDTRPDWLEFTLNRPARAVVALRSRNVPAWLSGWQGGSPVTLQTGTRTETARTFVRDFPAGKVSLGGVGAKPGGENVYFVMLAEQGGVPSQPPGVPAGLEEPQPNAACPAWVHDQYAALGPDGQWYPTWHPQIDPVYWCSFGHEHGSDPALSGSDYKPLYGYTAGRHGMNEPHVGFKTFVVIDPATGGSWMMTHHFGTGGQGRACTRFHTLDMAYAQGGTVKADLHLMGDFGVGRAVRLNTASFITGCSYDMVAVRRESTGTRNINLAGNGGYEPWRVDDRKVIVGFKSRDLTIDTGNAQTACADVACKTVVPRLGANGTQFRGEDRRFRLESPFSITAGVGTSGEFSSDPLGRTLVPATAHMATRQYIEPGLAARLSFYGRDCYTVDAWRGQMQCDRNSRSPGKVLENSIPGVN